MDELNNKKILIVDDEKDLLKMLSDILYTGGFSYVYTAADPDAALAVARSQPISLFVLDVNLPGMDGFALYGRLRELSQSPVIFLTARGEAEDRLRGLSLGADDYIVKPFLPRELLLRVCALLRRTYARPPEASSFRLSDRLVDFESAQVVCGERRLPLTAKEYALLKTLYLNRGRIVTNDALCMAVWGDGYYGYENTLMVHIRRLREKLEADPSHPRHLITARGLGYKLVIADE